MRLQFAFVALFCLSVIVRIPYINQPLSGNYQWLTAHTLITQEIWATDGIVEHHFLPVYTYPDSTNHNIMLGDLGSVEKNGRYYYISYPSFGFVLPYLATLGYSYIPIVLKIFNIFLHFLAALFLWKILQFYFQSLAAFITVAFFIFQPNLLWFHTNVYFLDILSMDLLIIQLYLTHRYLLSPHLKNAIYWLLTNFLLCQTEWIGYLVLLVIGLYFLYQKKYVAFWVIAASGILNLGFTFWQFGSYLGYENYFNALTQKGLKRIGNSEAVSHHWGEWRPLLFFIINFLIYEFTFIMAYFFNVGNLLAQMDILKKINFSIYSKLLILSGIPVLLHYFILFNFTTGHSVLASVIANPFLTFLLAPMLEVLVKTPNELGKKIGISMNIIILVMGIVFYFLRSNTDFQQYFKVHFANFQFTPTNEFEILGNYVKKITPKGYTACILTPELHLNPQIMYYSKKNIVVAFTPEEVVHYAKNKKVKLKVYKINEYWKVIEEYEVLP